MTRVVYADGPGSPRISPSGALAAAGLDGPPVVLLGWTLERHAWLDDPALSGSTMLAGYGLADAVRAGRLTPLPLRLSAVPALLAADPPEVGVVTGVRRGSGHAFGRSVGWGDVLARVADRVVVEVDHDGPDLGGPMIEGNVVAAVDRPAAPAAASPRPADDLDVEIGRRVAGLLPDRATLQFGPGGIGEGIARAIDRPVRIWSGLLTEAMATLHDRGLLLGPAVVAYTWPCAAVERLAVAGLVTLTSSTVTHDLTRVSSIPRFVGCNTALQVGLDGSVNVERIGDRVVAAVGGHSDFCAAASRSVGGRSIIALRSTTRAGHSTIVPHVDVVSTQRSDVDVVVTEHGVAHLRGASDAERAERLIGVAAPEHRAQLRVPGP